MALADTAPEIRRRQLASYREMGPERRVEVALELSEDLRTITQEGIRSRNPQATEAELHREWLRVLHGERLAGVLMDIYLAP